MNEEKNEKLEEKISEEPIKKPKYKPPVLSFEEYLEVVDGKRKIKGSYKIKAEDSERFLKYIEQR